MLRLKTVYFVGNDVMAEKFETAEWATAANIYEVNVRQYTAEGTFSAFEKALPRLREMGIEVLWFMPITPISLEKRQGSLGSYYAVSNYTAVNTEFGTIEDFKRVVEAAHASGFKVLIDWVANHTGYDNAWTKEHPDFYLKNEQGNFYEQYGWTDVIDLDYNNKALWKAMIEAMSFWVTECNIDGFRCDMAHLVPLDFWREARTTLDQQKKLFWLAECEVPAYHEVFDATYAWELLHTMEAVYRGEASTANLTEVLNKYDREFPAGALRLLFTTNHDENSHSGSEYERLGDGAKAFAVLCATWKNSLPLIYSGQEMPNKKRLKFFDKDQIDWTGQFFNSDFYKTLLALRKNCGASDVANTGSTATIVNTNAPSNIFCYIVKYERCEVLVLLNLSSSSKLKFGITDRFIEGKFTSVFTGVEIDVNEAVTFEMQGWEYLVYVKAT